MATRDKKVEQQGAIEFVRLGSMAIPPRAQRELKPARVDKLVADFEPNELGLPVVNERLGMFYILDGQHRIEAIKRWLGKGWEDQKIECRVYHGLSESEEADKFDRMNDTLHVNAFDKFRIRINAGREVEVKINHLVCKEGLKISRDKVPGGISAVGTLRRVYTRSTGDTLSKALRIIRDAFGDAGFEAQVIDGLGHLCQRYDGVLDESVAVERLSQTHGGVKGLLNKASIVYQAVGKTRGECVAAAAVDIINAKRGGKKLPSWWKEQ